MKDCSSQKLMRRRNFWFAHLFSCVAAFFLFLRPSTLATTNFVSIKDSIFMPERLAIYPGDTVTWTQDDSVEHSVTSQDRLFNSGSLATGGMFSFTFPDKGDFSYYCVFHGAGAMSGIISVIEPSDNTPPQTPASVLPLHGATNQPIAVRLNAAPFSDLDAADFHAASHWVVRYASNQVTVADSGAVSGANLTYYSPSGLIEETAYDWQVRYKDGRGAWSEFSAPARFTTLASFKVPGAGLRGAYYNAANFSNSPVVLTIATRRNLRLSRRLTLDAREG